MTMLSPSASRPWVVVAVSAVVGAGVGAAVMHWTMQRAAARSLSAEEKRQRELLQRLAEKTGRPDFDPTKRDASDILLELQLDLGVEPADGRWSPQTERAILAVLQGTSPAANPPVDPAQELEPEDDWEQQYRARLPDAVAACCHDDDVVTFDQAVLVVLERCFPDKGSFSLRPGTGAWKRAARERAVADLGSHLGPTELQARAKLTAPLGRRAMEQGADFGQAVRVMAERAWPAARWDGASRLPWQEAFCQSAAQAIQPA